MLINFELSEADLDYFRKVMLAACQSCTDLSREQIIEQANAMLLKVRQSNTSDFIRERMNQLDIMIDMLNDRRWDMSDQDSKRVLSALSYFADPQGLIPDDLPVLGYLDDAIMVQLVCKELEHEMQAYQEFLAFVAERPVSQAGSEDALNKADWMEERRQQLHARMRRRHQNQAAGKTSKSPFSLF